eukprot:6246846-Pyramimonas_sp.AAC.1
MTSKRELNIQNVVGEMQHIKAAYEQPDALVVSLFKEVCAIAQRSGIDCIRTERIHRKYMFVCMDNRYGDGVVPSDVLDLIAKIFRNGFKNSALQNP